MKSERHNAIRVLLSEGTLLSQDELRRKLMGRGFDVTQATLSRDIHDLRLFKGPNGYAVPNGAAEDDDLPSLDSMFANFGLTVRQAMNQLVLRTTTGSAQPVAAALDHAHVQERVAGAIGKLDKAKSFVRVVPLDGCLDGWAGGAVELWAARRRISKIAGRRLVAVVLETAAAGWTKISVSVAHVGFLEAHELAPSLGRATAIVNELRLPSE